MISGSGASSSTSGRARSSSGPPCRLVASSGSAGCPRAASCWGRPVGRRHGIRREWDTGDTGVAGAADGAGRSSRLISLSARPGSVDRKDASRAKAHDAASQTARCAGAKRAPSSVAVS